LLNVVNPTFDFENLFAVFAGLRTQLTSFLMVSKFQFAGFKTAVLALNFHMCFFFVIFLISLCNDHSTLSALVIDARALNLVHAELTRLDVAFTVLARFGLLCLYHLNY
jgi:phosphatidylserine synthase